MRQILRKLRHKLRLLRATPRRRLRGEVERVLQGALPPAVIAVPLHILLVGEPLDTHPPESHDYPMWLGRWGELLGTGDGVTVNVTLHWPTQAQWSLADVVVFYGSNAGWVEKEVPQLDEFLARGGGVVFLHYAINGRNDVSLLADRLGMAWSPCVSRYRYGWLNVKFGSHPLAAGFPDLRFNDEIFWNLTKGAGEIDEVGGAFHDGGQQALFWTRQQGQGRVFVSVLGHYNWIFDDPLFRILIFRGICWAGGQPMDRLSALAARKAQPA